MRPIDADALHGDYIVGGTSTNAPVKLYVSMEQINNAPTVDAVPVCRCNDCVHMKWKRNIYVDGTINLCRRCELDNKKHPNDWFCADGKRKEQSNDSKRN